MKNTYEIGKFYEKKCTTFLTKKGYQIETTNYRSLYGEIDIIAKKNKELFFIEVKSYKKPSHYILYKLTKQKKEKILATALDYIEKQNKNDYQINFMYMIVSKNNIVYYENVITMEII